MCLEVIIEGIAGPPEHLHEIQRLQRPQNKSRSQTWNERFLTFRIENRGSRRKSKKMSNIPAKLKAAWFARYFNWF